MEMQQHLQRYPHVAPELVSGDSPQNVLTDVYSLGYTINEVLTEIFGDSVHHHKDISSNCMSRLVVETMDSAIC